MARLSERKIARLVTKRKNVPTRWVQEGRRSHHGAIRPCTTSNNPMKPPHRTHGQFAPCQSPASSIVTIRLRDAIHREPRLPPSGM